MRRRKPQAALCRVYWGWHQFRWICHVSSVTTATRSQLKDSGSSQELLFTLPLFLTIINYNKLLYYKDLEASALSASVLSFWCSLQLSRKKPPDINCTDLLGNTPLHSAAYRSQKQCALKLLRSGADPNVKNENGTSSHPDSGDVLCLVMWRLRVSFIEFRHLV